MKKSKKPRQLLSVSHFVPVGAQAESLLEWKKVHCEIKNSAGKVIYSLKNVEAPTTWSQLAVEIAASKYFRKKGIANNPKGETSIRMLVRRVVDAISQSGREQKYFETSQQMEIFRQELTFILLTQRASFNSPVWFNCGLSQSYGIQSHSTHYIWDFKNKKVRQVSDAYENPQVSACFIQSVDDNLDSIFELMRNEAKLFKFGSGSGTNFSKLRSQHETLSGGGASSGLISFLEVLDRGAGSIKSGGVTRRAAKMVCLDVDHPEIVPFIQWKAKEEKKAQALIRAGYDSDFEGEAYHTVSGQNANNSVRVTNTFMKAVTQNKMWKLKSPVDRKTVHVIPAQEIWNQILSSSWACADPGLQFHDIIQSWHTCPQDGDIRASNPCSEYMFLDDSACNLASLNLLQFLKSDGSFDGEGYRHTAQVMFLAQDILVDFASYPTSRIADNSHRFRPIGLGFAGLGAFLMRQAIPYDSPVGRAWGASLTANLHGVAADTSTRLAEHLGAFSGFQKNKTDYLKVFRKHQKASSQIDWKLLPKGLKSETENIFQTALTRGKAKGFRNSQLTVMAPTGTIGLVMDCDTTGIEPEFSLIKFKKLVGGGKLKIVSQSILPALEKLQYSSEEIEIIQTSIEETGRIEGARFLKAEHLAIFDCANSNGHPTDDKLARVLSPESHLKMMAAIQPFLSGAISKTVNLPAHSTSESLAQIYFQAWKLGLKAIAIYRDGSKSSQPLNRTDGGPVCPECGGSTEISGGCYRCVNCGFTTGCIS